MILVFLDHNDSGKLRLTGSQAPELSKIPGSWV